MDLATFITQTQKRLWRPADTDLADALPDLILSAESRLRTDLKMTEVDITEELSVTENPFDLPAACDVLTEVFFNSHGPGHYVTPTEFNYGTERPDGGWPIYAHRSTRIGALDYTIEGQRLRHRFNVDANNPQDVRLVYTPRPASLTAGDDTIYNLYPDLYEKCVYVEALEYLLEEDRAARMEGRYVQRLEAALLDQSRRTFAGPIKMSMPRRDVS